MWDKNLNLITDRTKFFFAESKLSLEAILPQTKSNRSSFPGLFVGLSVKLYTILRHKNKLNLDIALRFNNML
jgi:hypothetical protein